LNVLGTRNNGGGAGEIKEGGSKNLDQ